MARLSTTPTRIDYANASRYRTSEATTSVDRSEPIGQLELNSVLSESVLLNASIGLFSNQIDALAANGRTDVSGHAIRAEDQALIDPAEVPEAPIAESLRDPQLTPVWLDRFKPWLIAAGVLIVVAGDHRQVLVVLEGRGDLLLAALLILALIALSLLLKLGVGTQLTIAAIRTTVQLLLVGLVPVILLVRKSAR